MGTTLASVMTTPADPNKKRHDVVIKMVKLANLILAKVMDTLSL
ncbi:MULTISPECIES: hypothetical protein [Acinetobacter]|nr:MULTISPECIES: hypothetical protein [Acinetobacter]ELW77363.1 hypothetical protein ACINWC743_A0250 [Acinetobacter sp. WC-743]